MNISDEAEVKYLCEDMSSINVYNIVANFANHDRVIRHIIILLIPRSIYD